MNKNIKKVISRINRIFFNAEFAALVFIVIGVIIIFLGFKYLYPKSFSVCLQITEDFYSNFGTEFISVGLTVLIIDRINKRREVLDRKRSLIQQMASKSNDFSLEAVRLLRIEGWLFDETLHGADLLGGNLENADLSNASLQEVDLLEANLKGVDLKNACLDKANLWQANLERSDLRGLSARNAHFFMANLKNADLAEANLEGAILRGAILEGAIFLKTNLSRADFRGVDISEIDLSQAILDEAKFDQ